nr:MAG TPA: hypothetical protein [Caudoviricetes sp.]
MRSNSSSVGDAVPKIMKLARSVLQPMISARTGDGTSYCAARMETGVGAQIILVSKST